MSKRENGFTLIELLIVMAVIAILAAIAYPSYRDSVRKTQESHQKEGAMQAATALERMSASFNAYPGVATSKTNSIKDPNGSDYALPYQGQMVYSYSPETTFASGTNTLARNYSLAVEETTARFGIKTWINSAGTRCFCSEGGGHACGGGNFTATTTSCSGIGTAF
ncbi:type IV pilin protein [Uliginosibacterium gangwonense]|uniref:type IV pilin protein n=1 Tax=Uliginosibacterium gangwonense TaxID=392736 RepID=UPI00037DD442|nr:prepilin-type N-terminal cleavage/methylation domain-containing protein [Uliginosibacterium gangwonense]